MMNRKLCRRCWSRSLALLRLARARRAARAGLRARVGRAGAGARRQPGRRVGRHHRAAGPAPDPGQAEPDRARAQRRPRRLHRRRAGDRLAAGAAAAIGQRQGAAGPAGQFRGGRLRAQARSADASSTARKATCTRPATRTSRPTRATSRRSPPRSARGCSRSTRPTRPTTRSARRTSRSAGSRRSRAGRAGGAAQGRRGRLAAQGVRLPVRLARHGGSRGARAQARRRADGVAPAAGAGRR